MSKSRSLERNVIKNLQDKMAKEREKKASRLKKVNVIKKAEVKPVKVVATINNQTDIQYAKRYVQKAKNASDLGHEFTLDFAQFKRLFNRKYCQLSGVKLVFSDDTSPYYPTLDRVNNSKGYIHGNVVCAASFVNQFKSYIENPINKMTFELASKVSVSTIKFIDK